MVFLKVLPRHSPGVTERDHENPQDNLCDSQGSDRVPPECMSESLLLESTCFLGLILEALFPFIFMLVPALEQVLKGTHQNSDGALCPTSHRSLLSFRSFLYQQDPRSLLHNSVFQQ
jgi:hypothetical protein